MDCDLHEEAAFWSTPRSFLAANSGRLERADCDYVSRAGLDNFESLQAAQRVLCDAGFFGATWPRVYGGAGGTPMEQAIVNQELAGIVGLPNHAGIGMCGPTLMAHGSDLAALRTAASSAMNESGDRP